MNQYIIGIYKIQVIHQGWLTVSGWSGGSEGGDEEDGYGGIGGGEDGGKAG